MRKIGVAEFMTSLIPQCASISDSRDTPQNMKLKQTKGVSRGDLANKTCIKKSMGIEGRIAFMYVTDQESKKERKKVFMMSPSPIG